MFDTIEHLEGQLLKALEREDELQKKQATLAESAVAESAAEMYLNDPEGTVAAFTDASLKARTESNLLAAASASLRRKRCELLARLTEARVERASVALEAKRAEYAALEADRLRLLAEIDKITARSATVHGEIRSGEDALTKAQYGGSTGVRQDYKRSLVKDENPAEGIVEAASVDELCQKAESLRLLRAVPTVSSVRSWAQAIENIVTKYRPSLLETRLQREQIDPNSGRGDMRESLVQQPRVYRVAYRDGAINLEESSLRFPKAGPLGRMGPEFSLSGRVHETGLV